MTSQILAYSNDPDFKQQLTEDCRLITGFAPIVHQSLEDLLALINILQQVEVLIFHRDDESEVPPHVLNLLFSGKYIIKNVICIGEAPPGQYDMMGFPPDAYPALLEHIRKIMPSVAGAEAGWSSMPIHAIGHFKKVPFDLYVKISDSKYIKRIPAHEEVEEAMLQDFKQRGILSLHFDRQYNRDFSQMLINNMINKIEGNHLNIEQQLVARGEVYKTVKEIVREIGVSSRVVEVCDTLISSITDEVLHGDDQFSKYMDRIKNNPDLALQHKFIELTCFIGGQLIFGMEGWDKTEQLRRFVFAAFFCDMTLNDTELIFCLHSKSFLELTTFQKKEVQSHAMKAAALVSKYKNAPPDVGIIIKQHHGSPEGVGFPEKKSPLLNPLAKVMIIAQELASGMLTNQEHVTALEILKKMVQLRRGTSLQNLVEQLELSLRMERKVEKSAA